MMNKFKRLWERQKDNVKVFGIFFISLIGGNIVMVVHHYTGMEPFHFIIGCFILYIVKEFINIKR